MRCQVIPQWPRPRRADARGNSGTASAGAERGRCRTAPGPEPARGRLVTVCHPLCPGPRFGAEFGSDSRRGRLEVMRHDPELDTVFRPVADYYRSRLATRGEVYGWGT